MIVPVGKVGIKEYAMKFDKDNPGGVLVWRVPNIREAIRADDGWKILTADYSQIELCLMAELSGDPWLVNGLNSGKDFHSYVASDVYHIPYEEIYGAYKDDSDSNHVLYTGYRSNSKRVSYLVPYGGGAGRLSEVTGLPEPESQSLIDKFFSNAVVLKAWLAEQAKIALMFGYSRSFRGRMRFYRLPNPDDPDADMKTSQISRWAGNQPIQSSCVDILKPAMVKIYLAIRDGVWTAPRKYNARIIITAHDEVGTTAINEHVEPVKKIMETEMQAAYDQVIKKVKNKVDVSVASYWSKG